MKKVVRIWCVAIIILTTVLSTGSPVFAQPKARPIPIIKATPTSSNVFINGNEVSLQAYNIGGANYLKPLDLSILLNATEKQFEVRFDSVSWTVNLSSNKAYSGTSTKLSNGDGKIIDAGYAQSRLTFDGVEQPIIGYFIGNGDYYKLRDLAKLLDFSVDWNETNNTIMIDTSKPYTE